MMRDEVPALPDKEKPSTKTPEERKAEKGLQKAEKQKRIAEKKAKQLLPIPSPSKQKPTEAKQPEAVKFVNTTPKGEKKLLGPLNDPIYSAYNPAVVEAAWYDWWEKQDFFKPEFDASGKPKERGTFVIVIPPPNITGALHCGHALAIALQDLLIRWNRMKGLTTLYLPGCDHASISTQSVIENMLWRREKKTRHDLGRPKFIERTLEWKHEYHSKINTVLRRLGGSFDWTREAFTMDENLTAAVMETFVSLHEEGYIYRSKRLVNWCVKLNTAVSNLEVENKELKGRTLLEVPGYEKKVEFGVITYFKYAIEGSSDFVEVATTRPETILGDTGIAVHPEDPRYKHLVGRFARHPFIDRILPIVADDYVDPEFGTGAVKITPAHDPNDYDLGGRHNLEFINILNNDGTMNQNAGKFQGQKRFDVRYSIVSELQNLGLFVKKDPNPMKVPVCSKTKDIIEPLIKPQWWIRMRELADVAMKAVREGDIKIRPESAEKNYFRWLENINDWCLSRQLWWGHQIPAYLVRFEGDSSAEEEWVTGRTEEEAQQKADTKFPGKSFKLVRDPDVLDTWFSSGLWPFATLGWPKKTHDLEHLYPTSFLETGWDILFFWVARMVILGLKLTGKVPFNEVYCHSLIRDSEGRKMSKSLGNVIDPVDVFQGLSLQGLQDKLHTGNLDPKELATASKYQRTAFPQGIPECGVDAVRFTLINLTTGGGDISLDVKLMAANRRFCNKVYQAAKYVLGKIEGYIPPSSAAKTGNESLVERWILHKLAVAAREINTALAGREFSTSARVLYRYWYDEICDVFIENSKTIILNGTSAEKESVINTLYTVLEGGLTLLHPFMPYLSEELWQRLPRRFGDLTPSIMRAAYPEEALIKAFADPQSAAEYELVIACSKGIRSLASEYGFKENGKAFVHLSTEPAYEIARTDARSIHVLSGKNIASVDVVGPRDSAPAGCAVHVVSATATVFLEVRDRVEVDSLIKSAEAKMTKTVEFLARQEILIASEDWNSKANEAVRDMEIARLKEAEGVKSNFAASIAQFEKLRLE